MMETPAVRRAESGMATLSIVGIVLAVLVVGGGVAWFATGGFGSDDTQETASGTTADRDTADPDAADSDPTEAEQGTGDGKVTTCTHSVDGEELTSYWKSSELFRFDIDTPVGPAHTIAIDRVFYTWGAGLPSGIKMPAMSGQDTPEMSSISPEFIENMPDNANANCSAYTGDDSIFDLPKDVTFRDMTGQ